jgi:hypothetical protein
VIACEIAGHRLDATGREIILVNTERPWHLESVDGSVQFEVLPTLLVEWDIQVEREWPGNTEAGPVPDGGR